MKKWIQAFRLRTLPLAFSSIFMGGFLANYSGNFNWSILGLCLLTTLFLQVLSNLANDYGDSIHGADSDERKGPTRAVQTGAITKEAMKTAIVICSALSFISGVALLFTSFSLDQSPYIIGFIVLGLSCIAAAIKYTAGDNPYGYAGLGDISVLVFFGLVGVIGTNYLFTQKITLTNIFPALSCGLFATGVLNVNNIRDIESDQKAGKRSIPVRLGKDKAVVYHWSLIIGGILSILVWSIMERQQNYLSYAYVLSFPLFIKNGIAISKAKSSQEIDPYLKQLALSSLLFTLLFGLGTTL